MKPSEFFKKLSSQNLSELERKTGVTRQALHNARKTQNMKLDNLDVLAKALNFHLGFQPLDTEENLLSSLVDFGVPLAHSGGGTLSLPEAVREGLKASRKDGAYESFLPYLFLVNVEMVDPLALAAAAFQTKEVNALGYFTEMANAFDPQPQFKFLLSLLEPAKSSSQEFLVKEKFSLYPDLFLKNRFALKWNLKVRGTPENHFERWRKWQRSQKSN